MADVSVKKRFKNYNNVKRSDVMSKYGESKTRHLLITYTNRIFKGRSSAQQTEGDTFIRHHKPQYKCGAIR